MSNPQVFHVHLVDIYKKVDAYEDKVIFDPETSSFQIAYGQADGGYSTPVPVPAFAEKDDNGATVGYCLEIRTDQDQSGMTDNVVDHSVRTPRDGVTYVEDYIIGAHVFDVGGQWYLRSTPEGLNACGLAMIALHADLGIEYLTSTTDECAQNLARCGVPGRGAIDWDDNGFTALAAVGANGAPKRLIRVDVHPPQVGEDLPTATVAAVTIANVK